MRHSAGAAGSLRRIQNTILQCRQVSRCDLVVAVKVSALGINLSNLAKQEALQRRYIALIDFSVAIGIALNTGAGRRTRTTGLAARLTGLKAALFAGELATEKSIRAM